MPRPRSDKTKQIKEKLITRLRSGFHPPGQRFFSNRGLAGQFGISYQTADRLIRELVTEGWLKRRPSAGTYVSGKSIALKGAILVFHQRAQRRNSFGARLYALLSTALQEADILFETKWTNEAARNMDESLLPVIWESPATVTSLANERRFSLVLNDTPPPGLASTYVDSIACDDFSGGAAAAEILHQSTNGNRFAIIAGPEDDARSRQRVAGFQSIVPKATVHWADSWDSESAIPLVVQLTHRTPGGIFCCSDRLAEGMVSNGISANIVGFDDAPVAERLDLTTIAIPWLEMVRDAVEIIRRRLQGETGPAAKRIIAPRPVMRSSHHATYKCLNRQDL